MSLLGEGYSWHPGLGTFLSLFLIVSLFLRRDKDLIPAAVALLALNSAVLLLRQIGSSGIGTVLNYYNFTTWTLEALTLLLALPNLRNKMRKVWWLPAALGAGILIIGTLMDLARNFNGAPLSWSRTVCPYMPASFCAHGWPTPI